MNHWTQLALTRREGLGVSWNTANDAALAEGKRVLIDDPPLRWGHGDRG